MNQGRPQNIFAGDARLEEWCTATIPFPSLPFFPSFPSLSPNPPLPSLSVLPSISFPQSLYIFLLPLPYLMRVWGYNPRKFFEFNDA
jgi:hypothetical protein